MVAVSLRYLKLFRGGHGRRLRYLKLTFLELDSITFNANDIEKTTGAGFGHHWSFREIRDLKHVLLIFGFREDVFYIEYHGKFA